MNGFSLVIVQRLYQLYPEAIMAQYYLNSLPRHLLTAQCLLELYPGGIRAADTVGALASTSLRICASNPPKLEIIRFLVEAAPSTVIQKKEQEVARRTNWLDALATETLRLRRTAERGCECHERNLCGCCQYAVGSIISCHGKRVEFCKATYYLNT
jgi:hypothetical protein